MPTGYYKRTKYHKKRLKEGAADRPAMTEEQKERIGLSMRKYWDRQRKGIKACRCCGRPVD